MPFQFVNGSVFGLLTRNSMARDKMLTLALTPWFFVCKFLSASGGNGANDEREQDLVSFITYDQGVLISTFICVGLTQPKPTDCHVIIHSMDTTIYSGPTIIGNIPSPPRNEICPDIAPLDDG